MYAREILSDLHKPLSFSDTGENAIVRMHEYNTNQMAVVDGDKYIGLITMDEVLSLKHLNDPIRNITAPLKRPYVHESSHIYEVMKAGVDYSVRMVPVLADADDRYIGAISAESCMRAFASLISVMDEGSVIELAIPIKDFQLSEIARIIESNGATMRSCFTTYDHDAGKVILTAKLNTNELASIIATFERFEYEVRAVFQETTYTEDVKDRYDALMRYLNV